MGQAARALTALRPGYALSHLLELGDEKGSGTSHGDREPARIPRLERLDRSTIVVDQRCFQPRRPTGRLAIVRGEVDASALWIPGSNGRRHKEIDGDPILRKPRSRLRSHQVPMKAGALMRLLQARVVS